MRRELSWSVVAAGSIAALMACVEVDIRAKTEARVSDLAAGLSALCQSGSRRAPAPDVFREEQQICFADDGADRIRADELVRKTPHSRASAFSRATLRAIVVDRSSVPSWGEGTDGTITFFRGGNRLWSEPVFLWFPYDSPWGCLPTDELELRRRDASMAGPLGTFTCVWEIQPIESDGAR